jgi:transposase
MTPEGIRAALGDRPRATILLEACGPSGWVARLLEELGHEVFVCNPHRLKLIAQSTLKTDKLDAEILGRLARLGQLDPAMIQATTVRRRDTQLKRTWLSVRERLVRSRTGHISAVKCILRNDALPVPKGDAERFVKNLEQLEMPSDVRELVEPLRYAILTETSQIAKVEARIRAMAKEMPIVGHLREVDGVGLLTAVAFALTIEDPSRFESSRDVGPYLGLVPRLRQSADTEWRGGCTKKGDERLRRLLVQAALALLRTKRESALKQWALRVIARRGRKKGVVALARKLAIVMHRLWVSGEAYEPFPHQEVTSAAA